MAKKKQSRKQKVKDHGHFIGALALFVGFSAFAMGSFIDSNNDYARYLSSVLDATGEEEVEEVADNFEDSPFTDVAVNSSSYEAIESLYYMGVVKGYDDGSFKPDKKVTRAEFSKMLVEASDLDYTVFNASDLAYCFPDVEDLPGHWFATSVCAAKIQGWVSGYANGGFGPGYDINKAEATKIVLIAFDFEVPDNESVEIMPFDDVNADDWFVGAAQAAMENGGIGASDDFDPGREVTRADVSSMIYNAMLAKELL